MGAIVLDAPPMVRRNDVAVKIDANVIREAKMVAASRDLTLAEYLSDLLRPLVHKDLEAETGKRLAPPPGPSSEPPKKKGGGR